MCTYPVQPCLHIPLAHPCLYYYLLSPQYTVLHILFHCTFYFIAHFTDLNSSFLLIFVLIFTYIYIYSLVLCLIFIFLHCPLSGPVLIYIPLLIISCIIEYVTNKRTLNSSFLPRLHQIKLLFSSALMATPLGASEMSTTLP